MEMLFYLIGNWCCNVAAALLLFHNQKLKRQAWETEKQELMISYDLQVMLLIGTFLRVYWSLSPPEVWSDEPKAIQWISFLDILLSPILWGTVFYNLGYKQQKFNKVPAYISWKAMLVLAIAAGLIGSSLLPVHHTDDAAWYYADVCVITNMVLDGLAMVPQMWHIANAEEKTTPEASHFIGLLCLGRLFRMVFWGIISSHLMYRGDSQGSYLWTFIIPDVIHTVIMGDYLYLWMKKVKKDKIDPYINGEALHL